MIRAHSKVARGLTIRAQSIAFAIVTLACCHSRLEIIYTRQIYLSTSVLCAKLCHILAELNYEIYYRLVSYRQCEKDYNANFLNYFSVDKNSLYFRRRIAKAH